MTKIRNNNPKQNRHNNTHQKVQNIDIRKTKLKQKEMKYFKNYCVSRCCRLAFHFKFKINYITKLETIKKKKRKRHETYPHKILNKCKIYQ